MMCLLYFIDLLRRSALADLVRAMEDGGLNTYVANYLVDYGARLRRNGVVGVFVLDGAPLPAKYSTRELREQARQEGARLLEEELAKPEGRLQLHMVLTFFFCRSQSEIKITKYFAMKSGVTQAMLEAVLNRLREDGHQYLVTLCVSRTGNVHLLPARLESQSTHNHQNWMQRTQTAHLSLYAL